MIHSIQWEQSPISPIHAESLLVETIDRLEFLDSLDLSRDQLNTRLEECDHYQMTLRAAFNSIKHALEMIESGQIDKATKTLNQFIDYNGEAL